MCLRNLYIPLDSYSKKINNNITFLKYISYLINQNNDQTNFFNNVRVC
jgi:hypothetical protein